MAILTSALELFIAATSFLTAGGAVLYTTLKPTPEKPRLHPNISFLKSPMEDLENLSDEDMYSNTSTTSQKETMSTKFKTFMDYSDKVTKSPLTFTSSSTSVSLNYGIEPDKSEGNKQEETSLNIDGISYTIYRGDKKDKQETENQKTECRYSVKSEGESASDQKPEKIATEQKNKFISEFKEKCEESKTKGLKSVTQKQK